MVCFDIFDNFMHVAMKLDHLHYLFPPLTCPKYLNKENENNKSLTLSDNFVESEKLYQ